MKKTILLSAALIIISACSSSKKSTSTAPVPPTPPATPVVAAKPSNGIYDPGNDELTAIQAQYKDVSLEKLKQGYVLYAHSACISCHEAQNIYKFDEMRWGFIMNDMAVRAKLTPEQKDAVYKYVLAIKAAKQK